MQISGRIRLNIHRERLIQAAALAGPWKNRDSLRWWLWWSGSIHVALVLDGYEAFGRRQTGSRRLDGQHSVVGQRRSDVLDVDALGQRVLADVETTRHVARVALLLVLSMHLSTTTQLVIGWVVVLCPTQHKIGHFRDVPQGNLLAWYGKQELIRRWDSERELLRSAPEATRIRWNNAK